ncbi:hypothetical protein V0U79_06975 [Hyphobacterium sp. HN65]|uniref:YggT family protein n=1 Tax=Hyphobacterium lacteum TaxID=3116575 RepID=A0ABU7LR90_9PROT|nr:hypothetical protein [Hyphobacterium sp. HN65]MEE2526104.1 hypothetical protein [Hyphobacterium sp. HN65]
MDAVIDRVSDGFTAMDWWLILVWSLFGALIMRRMTQLPVVVGLAFVADTVTPYFFRIGTGMPPDLAFNYMLTRLDGRGGLVLLSTVFIYFVLIGLLFTLKGRFRA